jgi:hypothetical protein
MVVLNIGIDIEDSLNIEDFESYNWFDMMVVIVIVVVT